jgi:hypothetical protein
VSLEMRLEPVLRELPRYSHDLGKSNEAINGHAQLLNLLCDIMKPGSRVVLVTSSLRNEAPAPSWDDLGSIASIDCEYPSREW